MHTHTHRCPGERKKEEVGLNVLAEEEEIWKNYQLAVEPGLIGPIIITKRVLLFSWSSLNKGDK